MYEEYIKNLNDQLSGIQSEVDTIDTEIPEIDLSESIDKFCDTLKFEDSAERVSRVVNFVKPAVNNALSTWGSNLSHVHGTTLKIHSLLDDVGEEKDKIEAKINSRSTSIGAKEFEIETLQEKCAKINNKKADVKPITRYSVWSYRIFILGSLLVGCVTAWYYLTTQVSIAAARSGKIISAISDDENAYRSTLDYLSENPEAWVYGLGVVLFILSGKIISIIYEKLGHANWFSIPIALLCLVTVFASVYLVSDVGNKSNRLSTLNQEVTLVNEDPILRNACVNDPSSFEECTSIIELNNQFEEAKSDLAESSFYMTMLVLTAEILLGAVAWMLASEYHQKTLLEGDLIDQKLKTVSELMELRKDELMQIKAESMELSKYKKEMDNYSFMLTTIKNKLPTREFIEGIKKQTTAQELQKAKAILQSKTYQWEVENRQNNV